jgi:hypothetical protein
MAHMSDLKTVNTQELGEVIDMIKDMEEAIYYCHISKAMEESKEGETIVHHTLPYMRHEQHQKDMEGKEIK